MTNPSSFILHPSSFQTPCPPKINLYLRVVRRREDGFHELETVFQSVGGGDMLRVSGADRLGLVCDDPHTPTDESNLVLKAARLLQQRFPEARGRGAALHLTKRTPIGAGMGGGSADGAAALVLLSRAWNLEPSTVELAELAAELGSDVPFFLLGGTALARGRGELLTALPTARLWVVLLKPDVSVSTPWAYRQWRAEACGGRSLDEFVDALRSGQPGRIAEALRNDLEPGVAAGVPEIAAARDWLRRQELLGVRMTGSGSVVFGVAEDEAQARRIAARSGAPGLLWAAPALTAGEATLRPSPSGGSGPPARSPL